MPAALQFACFAGYARWTYLCIPFLFELPGVLPEEIEPRQENGESWRRLRTAFRPRVPSHGTVRIFYFDQAGLLRRHDYETDVMEEFRPPMTCLIIKNSPEFSCLPNDGHFGPEPPVVSIDLSEVEFN